jgi:phosphopentomutase
MLLKQEGLNMARSIILMLDSLGIGGAPDAAAFGNEHANTLAACVAYRRSINRPLYTPHLAQLGLFHAAQLSDPNHDWPLAAVVTGAYGACSELSTGKDTPSGHWEMAGVPVLFDWGYFTDRTHSFPEALLQAIMQKTGLNGYLGNCHASGTDILDRLGEEHIRSGLPIFYTSADSVFQIACHETHFGLDRLYALCETVRTILMPYNIGRVIARPFVGERTGEFKRTGNRHDYSVLPPAPTILNKVIDEMGGEVFAVGKIADIYAHSGITHEIKATGLMALFDASLACLDKADEASIIFTNFVDFDANFGHRRDVAGYADALELLDDRLPELLACLRPDDIVYITADHGCDPTWPGSDHTRERVPFLMAGPSVEPRNLGIRDSFADIGQTIATQLGLSPMPYGLSALD